MAKIGYSIQTGTAVALTAATPKCVLGVQGHANFGVDVQGFWVSFDGVTSSAAVVLVEFGFCTWTTNPPGTASTTVAGNYLYGGTAAAGFTAAKTWTAEPITITSLMAFDLDPNKSLFVYDWALGQTPNVQTLAATPEGYVIRCTAPAGVNVRAGMRIERA